ncbi:MAG TPA: transcriptional repressor LexA [Accumulibacter sp.]|uniref:transcriptional repressor LexA n=3 Tax=Accumulibacter sp. TaxID=2053492 RepID=UPI00261DCE4A|nr:transcriptional repressor LexA [Accumulibacter sp.]MDS4015657.1 transcriptional repressor LexA [Accumulibacter sp.]MDS4053534.1 transcriptional repressor LexA [Accumulibacter sp.]HMV04508.1 transcriptional repressor LexA [Accumulibacter sp.]HMW63843.1 transcriptional repressor LexA [Accumulibacter sp.]HMW80848.1 transcriptional repressor LexA [Accumulibacter sp.]
MMARSSSLTVRQQEVLDFIRNTMEVLGAPPTRAEIANAFGFASHNGAEEHLRALARKGVILLEPGSARGIRLVEQLGLPLIGSVAAGSPLLAVENIQRRYTVEASLFNPRADFLLRVRGLSMINAGILDGDLLAVHRTSEARNGQIVVARLDDEVTVKRFRQQGNVLELLPENPDFAPIVVDTKANALSIEGIVVGLIRRGEVV